MSHTMSESLQWTFPHHTACVVLGHCCGSCEWLIRLCVTPETQSQRSVPAAARDSQCLVTMTVAQQLSAKSERFCTTQWPGNCVTGHWVACAKPAYIFGYVHHIGKSDSPMAAWPVLSLAFSSSAGGCRSCSKLKPIPERKMYIFIIQEWQ